MSEDDDEGFGYMMDKLLKNGWKYVDFGFVYDFMDIVIVEYYLVRVYVWFLMRGDLLYNVVVVLFLNSGVVIYVFCELCRVFLLGCCSYVVVVLFIVFDYI